MIGSAIVAGATTGVVEADRVLAGAPAEPDPPVFDAEPDNDD